MKLEKLDKKLNLNKETLRSLTEKEADKVNGGMSGSRCGWDTCIIICKGTKLC